MLSAPRLSLSEQWKPIGCVSLVVAPENGYSQLRHRYAPAANGGLRERTGIEIRPLDQEVRDSARSAESTDLRPEARFDDRAVEIEDCLSLHDAGASDVVPGGEESNVVGDPAIPKKIRNAARLFEAVGNDPHARALHDPKRAPLTTPRLVSLQGRDT
jgi:hypothetical protein